MNTFPRYIWFASLSAALVVSAGACKSSTNPESAQAQVQDENPSQDPATANVAPVSNASAQGGSYDTTAEASNAPPPSGTGSYPAQQPEAYVSGQSPQDQGNYDSDDQPVEYAPQPPPPLPEYDQPPCPGDDYIWTPGYWYWAQDAGGYYWVPGAWVYAPYQGALWTPGYWGYDRGRYGWHRGYWGRHIGYYGGIDYGFGYIGFGYQGGYWHDNHFDYNRSVNNVDTNRVHNVYNYRVENQARNGNRLSYNGPGGIQVRPRPAEIQARREQHTPPMSAQMQQVQAARSNRGNFAKENHGRPQNVTVAKPLPADHNIHAPAPVPMNRPGSVSNERSGQQGAHPQQRMNEPTRTNEPSTNRPGTRPEAAPRQQEQQRQPQQHPAPVPRPEHQQPAPERQAPQQHAQPAPERQAPAEPHRPMQQQRPAPVEHPQHQQPAPSQRPAETRPEPRPQETRPAPPPREEHATPRPKEEHKPEQKPKPPEKEKHPQ